MEILKKIERIKFRKKWYKNKDKEVNEYVKDTPKLSKEELKEIDKVWGKYPKINKDWHRFYKNASGRFSPYYIPSDLYYSYINSVFTKRFTLGRSHFSEKNYFDLIFTEIKKPEVIARKIDGIFLDKNFKPISEDEVKKRCFESDDVVIKASWESCQGQSVDVLFKTDENYEEKIAKSLKSHNNIIIQRAIDQHEKMKALNPTAVNTFRVLTMLWKDEVKILGSIVRIGTESSRVDNLVQSNGISCGVNLETGKLIETGYDKYGKRIKELPNGIVLGEYELPGISKLVETVKKNHYRIPNNRIIGWDIAIDKDEDPVLIEANLHAPAIYFHQLAGGPLFGEGEFFKEVMEYVFGK